MQILSFGTARQNVKGHSIQLQWEQNVASDTEWQIRNFGSIRASERIVRENYEREEFIKE